MQTSTQAHSKVIHRSELAGVEYTAVVRMRRGFIRIISMVGKLHRASS